MLKRSLTYRRLYRMVSKLISDIECCETDKLMKDNKNIIKNDACSNYPCGEV